MLKPVIFLKSKIFNLKPTQKGFTPTSPRLRRVKVVSPAFTIVELLVVIVVIGILAAITLVSYTGITSRANVASMQSDLTNAATTLKLDQIQDTNGDFPTALGVANGGKGIVPNPSLDYSKYIADNTSNPKNFCLQYRKGTDNYAVDNNSAPSKGVCLVNMVTNGDFRNGGTGWGVQGFTGYTIANNEFIGTAVAGGDKIATYNLPFISGHKYYMSSYIKADSTNVVVMSYDGVTGFYGYSNGSGSYALASNVFIAGNTTANTGQFQIVRDNRSSGRTQVGAKNGTLIDITATFGAGNEPNQASMDATMGSYPNGWFNIVAKVNL